MSAALKNRNRLALMALVLAKVCGIVGIILAFAGQRTAGAVLIGFAFVFVAFAIGLTVAVMRVSEHEETGDLAVLEKMVREGTLKQYLRDVEDKLREEREGKAGG
jgi:cyanate permease